MLKEQRESKFLICQLYYIHRKESLFFNWLLFSSIYFKWYCGDVVEKKSSILAAKITLTSGAFISYLQTFRNSNFIPLCRNDAALHCKYRCIL